MGHKNTNAPLILKIRDIIFFYFGQTKLWAISRDILRGPRLFWPLKLSRAQRGTIRGQKSLGPLEKSLEMAYYVVRPQKKIISRIFKISGALVVNLGLIFCCIQTTEYFL